MDFSYPDRTHCDYLYLWRGQCDWAISHVDHTLDHDDQEPISGALFYGVSQLQTDLESHHVWLFYCDRWPHCPRLFNEQQLAS